MSVVKVANRLRTKVSGSTQTHLDRRDVEVRIGNIALEKTGVEECVRLADIPLVAVRIQEILPVCAKQSELSSQRLHNCSDLTFRKMSFGKDGYGREDDSSITEADY